LSFFPSERPGGSHPCARPSRFHRVCPMSGIDKPLYLVMHKDQWVTRRQMVGELIAVPAFGSESEAWDFARETCRESRHLIRNYRVVTFVYMELAVGK
jgi:hypothetical protein